MLKLVFMNGLRRDFPKGMKYIIGLKTVFHDNVMYQGIKNGGRVCDQGCNFSTFPLEFSFTLFGLTYKPSFQGTCKKSQFIKPFQEQNRRILARNFYGLFWGSRDKGCIEMSVFTELKELVLRAQLWRRRKGGNFNTSAYPNKGIIFQVHRDFNILENPKKCLKRKNPVKNVQRNKYISH